ncbi:MAG: cytochrome B6, partial [Rhodocyclaceae bacterium]|nr:cytochrome B6 [Rhodocyclaceae bacterium]
MTLTPPQRKLAAAVVLAVGAALLLAFLAGGRRPMPEREGGGRAAAPAAATTPGPVAILVRPAGLDPAKLLLGRRLFHDKRLSGDDTVSCASCHDLARGGMDGRPQAVGVRGLRGDMNTPTVLNSGFSFRQFWDGRAADLEEQAAGPVHNPIEMDSNWRQVLGKLAGDTDYKHAFDKIYGRMDGAAIQDAIATYERSLVTVDSPFDRHLAGDATALSPEAAEGWRLFRELGCISCHQGVNLGGNMYAGLGVMGDFFRERGRPVGKADLGRFNVTGREEDRHVFKVPSLRNVAQTAPYF